MLKSGLLHQTRFCLYMSYLQQSSWRMVHLFSRLLSMPSFLRNVPLVYFAHFFSFFLFVTKRKERDFSTTRSQASPRQLVTATSHPYTGRKCASDKHEDESSHFSWVRSTGKITIPFSSRYILFWFTILYFTSLQSLIIKIVLFTVVANDAEAR